MTRGALSMAAFTWLTLAGVHAATNSTAAASCDATQLSMSSDLWRIAGIWPACASYAKSNAIGNSTQFTWPCSATNCTKELENMINAMPACVDSGNTLTERAWVQAKVTACKESASASSGSSDSATTKPTTGVSTTSPPSSTTKAPTKSYSSVSCTLSQESNITSQFLTAARNSDCKAYGMTSMYWITIFAPCTSTCVTDTYEALVDSVPDCFLGRTGSDYVNKKEELANALLNCTGETAATSLYIYLGTADSMEAVHDTKTPSPYSGMKSDAVARQSPVAWAWLQLAAIASVSALQFTFIR